MDVSSLPASLRPRISVGLDCWEWTGWKNDDGYGYVRWDGRDRPAHRVVMELLGRVQDGQDVDHLCRNRACVNPDHLEAVSHEENVRRSGKARRRSACARGHDLSDPQNVYVRRNGGKACRPCAMRRAGDRYRRVGHPERNRIGDPSTGLCRVTLEVYGRA